MGRMIYYEHRRVTGYKRDEKGNFRHKASDDFIHQRQQDPILMACGRNNEMAECEKFYVDTQPAFNRWVDDVIMCFVPSRAEAEPEYEY